jgi:hypothetical protein
MEEIMLNILLITFGSFLACSDKSDSADSGAVEADASPSVDSCSWTDTCAEYTDWDGTEAWCTDVIGGYGLSYTYAASACASGSVYTCSMPTGGDYTVAASVYYYNMDAADAEATCSASGGT